MSSKMKPHEMRNLAPAKESPVFRYKNEDKKASLQAAIAARKAELKRQNSKGHAAVWFMCVVAALFLAFGHGYEMGMQHQEESSSQEVNCGKFSVKGHL